jgi:hypothetical protein
MIVDARRVRFRSIAGGVPSLAIRLLRWSWRSLTSLAQGMSAEEMDELLGRP